MTTTPRNTEFKQAKIYRKMSVEQKLDMVFYMWAFSQELNRSGRLLSKDKWDSNEKLVPSRDE